MSSIEVLKWLHPYKQLIKRRMNGQMSWQGKMNKWANQNAQGYGHGAHVERVQNHGDVPVQEDLEQDPMEEQDAMALAPEYPWEPGCTFTHPLDAAWSLWFFKMDRNRDWCDNNRLVGTFETIEGFWGLYHAVIKASMLPNGCDYSLFKKDIRPMWEDTHNKHGGRWLVNLNPQLRAMNLDFLWRETLMSLVGEAYSPYGSEICGAVINVRQKGDKLGLWTRDLRKRDAIMHIGKILKQRVNIPPNCPIGYESHMDPSRGGSSVKNCYDL